MLNATQDGMRAAAVLRAERAFNELDEEIARLEQQEQNHKDSIATSMQQATFISRARAVADEQDKAGLNDDRQELVGRLKALGDRAGVPLEQIIPAAAQPKVG